MRLSTQKKLQSIRVKVNILSKADCIIVKIHCQSDLHYLSKSIYRLRTGVL